MLRFKQNVSPRDAVALWYPVTGPALALSNQLQPALKVGLKNRERVAEAIGTFRTLVEATKAANAQIFQGFADEVEN
jgi:hypothetical protein